LTYGKTIGIIVELKGRKLKPESIHFPKKDFFFEKKENIILTNRYQLVQSGCSNQSTVVLKFRKLNEMLKIGDKIIIDENRGLLTVENIINYKREIAIENSPTSNTHNLKIIQTSERVGCSLPEINVSKTRDVIKEINFNPDISEYSKMIKRGRIHNAKSSLFQDTRYDIVCSVDFNCFITCDSVFYFPSVDYLKHEIDILSLREVAEISLLSEYHVNFMNITLDHVNDINSFKEILGDNNRIKLIASVTNYNVSINFDH
jgi:pyruvate kinase